MTLVTAHLLIILNTLVLQITQGPNSSETTFQIIKLGDTGLNKKMYNFSKD